MPNLIIETSRPDLISQPAKLLTHLNQNLWQTQQFGKPEDIKSRLIFPTHVLIGLEQGGHDFIYVHFYLMPGRNDTTKKMLVETITQSIVNHIKEQEKLDTQGKLQICVNPIELSDNYQKVAI